MNKARIRDLINRMLRNQKQAILAASRNDVRTLEFFIDESNRIVSELENLL